MTQETKNIARVTDRIGETTGHGHVVDFAAAASLSAQSDLLTIAEVAQILRCSKAHVCNLINGKVKNTPRLPAICMGRRRLVRRATLELWKRACEQGTKIDGMMPPSGKSAVDAWKEEEFHA